MMNDDTVGWHLQEAWMAASMAGYRCKGGPVPIEAYRDEGRFYGAAFRAAELAYDLGEKHAIKWAVRALR